MAKKKSKFSKDGKKLLGFALDGFYYFPDDQIEELLDKALIKFQGRVDWKKQTRVYLFSFAPIRQKICELAKEIYGDIKEKQ